MERTTITTVCLIGLLLGCDPFEEGRPITSADLAPPDSGIVGGAFDFNPPPVPWENVGQLTVDDFGNTEWISLSYPANQRYVAVRTVPIDAGESASSRACYQVLQALSSSGEELIPQQGLPLGPDDQRLIPGPGAGVFVFSTTEDDFHTSDVLWLQLDLVDCASSVPASRSLFPDLPTRLRVDAAWEPELHTGPPVVAARILRAEDSGWGAFDEDSNLAAAWEVARERFADIGMHLVLQGEAAMPDVGVLEYEADMVAFGELDAGVRELLSTGDDDTRFVPIALVRCLEYDDPISGTRVRPQGQTTRFSGSIADPSTPSIVALASGDCGVEEAVLEHDPEHYGIVLSHEIGHYLGLLHTDTLGDHLHADDDEQLMRSTIATKVEPGDAWFSPSQGRVMRRHPDVFWIVE